jgi:hypothetical protein
MSKKIAPRVQLNFEPEHISDEEPPSEAGDEEKDMPRDMPEVIERKEIVENDIFDTINDVNPSLNGMGEDIIYSEAKEEEKLEETPKPKPKPVKTEPPAKQTKKKRQLSEEHKAKLALAREKALATRRAKAEEKKKMKEIENKTKELRKKKAQKDLEQLEDEVTNNKPQKTSLDTTSYPTSMFTKKDLEDAQLDAIMKYEAIRKARKEEKKKQQMIDQQKKDLQKKIQGYGARDANGRLLNKWDRCY